MRKKRLFWIVVAAALLLPTASTVAQTPRTQGSISLPAPIVTSIAEVPKFICAAIDWIFTFLVILTILFIIVAAFKYLTSAGDPTRVKSANNTLIFAAVAIVVALVAKGIPLVLIDFFGTRNAGAAFNTACRGT